MTRVSSETRVAPLESGCAPPADTARSRSAGKQCRGVDAGQTGRAAGSHAGPAVDGTSTSRPTPTSRSPRPRGRRRSTRRTRPRWRRTCRGGRGPRDTCMSIRAATSRPASATCFATRTRPWRSPGCTARRARRRCPPRFARSSSASPRNRPASTRADYERVSDLVLPPNLPRDLAAARLQREFLPGIRRLCPGFDGYPQPAQRALVDMAYNLGVGGLAKFPSMLQACERGDFAAAAGECHRRTCRDDRNEATRELFLAASHLTNAIQALVARGAAMMKAARTATFVRYHRDRGRRRCRRRAAA